MIRLASGASAVVTKLEAERIWLVSAEAAAPGTPLGVTLEASGQIMRVKVFRCRRISAAADVAAVRFEIEGRLIDATRVLRALIVQALAQPARDD